MGKEEVTGMETDIALAVLSPLFTALLTAYVTSKANERVLNRIIEQIDDLEDRVFTHERRISKLEGLFKSGA